MSAFQSLLESRRVSLVAFAKMSLPHPKHGFLYLEDDEDVIHVFRITRAEFNIYENDKVTWLTLYCRADVKIEPDDGMNPEPWVEINIPILDAGAEDLRVGQKVTGRAYDDAFGGNLTNMYFYSHAGLEDPLIEVEGRTESSVTVRITGESVSGPVTLLAEFLLSSQTKRSFT